MKTFRNKGLTKLSPTVKTAKSILVLLFIVSSVMLRAQDKLTLRDGTDIEGKVVEINATEVKYTSKENLNALRAIPKSDVFMIRYANGTKEVFEEEKTIPAYDTHDQIPATYNQKYDPDTSDFAKLRQKKFSGPRVGFTLLGDGTNADYLATKNKRQNFVQFGWQFETVLFTAGNTSGLVEFVPLIGGFEQGLFIPSINVLLGIRGGEKTMFEFAMGPNFSVGRDYQQNLRGTVGLVIAIGSNFRKDKINFPVTLAFVPSVGNTEEVYDSASGTTTISKYETGYRISLLVGFNTRKH